VFVLRTVVERMHLYLPEWNSVGGTFVCLYAGVGPCHRTGALIKKVVRFAGASKGHPRPILSHFIS